MLRVGGRLRAGGLAIVDSDAAAWAAAVVVAGGTYSPTTLTAVSAFVTLAKASGYWTKLNRINLFCGDQLAAALVPLKAGSGSATETNVNFVGGDYTEATGITGNGSTKYLDTGLVASTALTLNDTHLAVYNRASGAAGGGAHIGCNDGANFFEMLVPFTDGIAYSRHYNNSAASGLLTVATGAPYGLMVSSRTGAASHVVYKAGASIVSDTNTGGARPARAIYVFARNSSGTANVFTSHALAGYSIGSGLTGADVTAYTTHLQAFQTSLGRNV